MSNENTWAYSEALSVRGDRCFFCGKQSSDGGRKSVTIFLVIVGSVLKDDTLLHGEDLTVTLYPAGRGHTSVTTPTRGFIGIFLQMKVILESFRKIVLS